jgi:hypothetical protein
MRPFLNLGLMVLMGAALPAADGDSQPALQQSGAQSTPRGGPGSPRAEPDRRAVLRVDKTLISIPVAVSDAQSRFVTGLDMTNFRIFEDKVEQEISHLSSEDAPLSVGIVFDTSGSMGAKLSWSRQAVSQFLNIANAEDESLLGRVQQLPAFGGPIYSKRGRDSKSPYIYAGQEEYCASRRPVHGDEPDEEGPQSAQGYPDHLRRWRQLKSLTPKGK